jgi:hypothetical protein
MATADPQAPVAPKSLKDFMFLNRKRISSGSDRQAWPWRRWRAFQQA